MEQKDTLNELDSDGLVMLAKVKAMVDGAYKTGYMDGIKSLTGNSDRKVRRIVVTPSMVLAILIIVLGSVFSLGMYIGGLNV